MSTKTIRCITNQRLAYYRTKADVAYWDTHWQAVFSERILVRAETGALGIFEAPFVKYLPKKGRILEAGCGLGQYVLALNARGYQAEGVEWGPHTVKRVKSLYPQLPIRVADVTRLDAPSDYYQGYISLGVVEHREAGPEPFLTEAYRVLAPQGVALISVPYFNELRRLKSKLGFFRTSSTYAEFYQYAFLRNEFAALVKKAGFDVKKYLVYDGYKGLKDEIIGLEFLLRKLFELPGLGWRLRRQLRYNSLGHMLMLVCKK